MHHATRLLLTTALLTTLVQPAWALYKVVGPDGRVTYTDRPPTEAPAKPLKPMKGIKPGAGPDAAVLPFELRQVVERYPVTLYTSSNCGPCDNARNLLKGRGVPFQELTVNTADDVRAFRSKEGADQLPVLKVGAQQLRGLSAQEWASYLDAAGYPSASMLPANYSWPAPSPLVSPKPQVAERSQPTPASEAPAADGASSTPGFRF